jgi:hypothetical protein
VDILASYAWRPLNWSKDSEFISLPSTEKKKSASSVAKSAKIILFFGSTGTRSIKGDQVIVPPVEQNSTATFPFKCT